MKFPFFWDSFHFKIKMPHHRWTDNELKLVNKGIQEGLHPNEIKRTYLNWIPLSSIQYQTKILRKKPKLKIQAL
jgi:hypothetical protein